MNSKTGLITQRIQFPWFSKQISHKSSWLPFSWLLQILKKQKNISTIDKISTYLVTNVIQTLTRPTENLSMEIYSQCENSSSITNISFLFCKLRVWTYLIQQHHRINFMSIWRKFPFETRIWCSVLKIFMRSHTLYMFYFF